MYRLTALAEEVSREDPVTGEKKKKAMRKTYKGQIKLLGLSGNLEAVKGGAEDGLFSMMAMPDEEWRSVAGGEMETAWGDIKQSGQLARAAMMAEGALTKAQWDDAIFDMGEKAMPVQPLQPVQPVQQIHVAKAPQRKLEKVDERRPRRVSKKRSYKESSFEGYSEGYVDDRMEDGYSTGESEAFGKRRKKVRRTLAWRAI